MDSFARSAQSETQTSKYPINERWLQAKSNRILFQTSLTPNDAKMSHIRVRIGLPERGEVVAFPQRSITRQPRSSRASVLYDDNAHAQCMVTPSCPTRANCRYRQGLVNTNFRKKPASCAKRLCSTGSQDHRQSRSYCWTLSALRRESLELLRALFFGPSMHGSLPAPPTRVSCPVRRQPAVRLHAQKCHSLSARHERHHNII